MRRVVVWGDNFTPMKQSHLKNAEFFNNPARRCNVTDPNGTERTVTYNDDPLVPLLVSHSKL